MSEFSMSDINNLRVDTSGKRAERSTSTKAGQGLEMDDFLMLMVATLQNQSIDETADTSDMLNQMVQMSVITAINNINSLITESTSLTYAASLVGKHVTVGIYENGKLKEIYGEVTGTGTLNGQQVIFMGDDIYYLSDVMAVGKLPASDEEKAKNETPAAGAGDKYQDKDINGNTERIYFGTDGEFGTEDDYYEKDVDGDGKVERVYPGKSREFGTADDYYEKDVDNDGVAERVYPGQGGVFSAEDGYYEKVVGGNVERIYAGVDGLFGTEDDYYEKEVDGEKIRINRGADGKFGAEEKSDEDTDDGGGDGEDD